jgi:hypothetical protein
MAQRDPGVVQKEGLCEGDAVGETAECDRAIRATEKIEHYM